MKALGVTVTIATYLALPPLALAHRPASRTQKAAMMYHAGSHYDHLSASQIDAPKAYPLRCAIADIATVVKGARWGAWSFNGHKHRSPQCMRWASNGWVIEHRIGARWYVIAEGDQLAPHIPGVPHHIAVDLIKGLEKAS